MSPIPYQVAVVAGLLDTPAGPTNTGAAVVVLVVVAVGAAPAGVAGVVGAGNNVVVVAGGPADAIGRDPTAVGVATVVEGGRGRGVAAVVVGCVLGTVGKMSSIEIEGAGEGRTVVGTRIVFVVGGLGEEFTPPP
jgi:hypothetical protein